MIDNSEDVRWGILIVHEEHKTFEIPPGKYDISRQREIDPDTEEVRSVLDLEGRDSRRTVALEVA